jgi:argininosuccinate lyase
MTKKLWQKDTELNKLVEQFTIGSDKEYDLLLAPYDVRASKAHAVMLEKCGLLNKADMKKLMPAFNAIARQIEQGKFKIDAGV